MPACKAIGLCMILIPVITFALFLTHHGVKNILLPQIKKIKFDIPEYDFKLVAAGVTAIVLTLLITLKNRGIVTECPTTAKVITKTLTYGV